MGALLESTHRPYRQHLFMNGPTIAHPPPTATADRGRRRDKSPNQKEIKKNRQSEEEGKKKAKSLNKMFY